MREKISAEKSAENARLFNFLILANFLQYMEAGAVPALLLQISGSFNMRSGQEGLLGAVVYLSLSLGGPLAGFLLRSYVHKSVVLCAVISNMIFTFLWALTPVGQWFSTYMFIIVRFLMGLCQCIVCVYLPLWTNENAPKESRTTWMSYLQASVPFGVMSGYIIAAVVINLSRNSEVCLGILCWRWPFLVEIVLLSPLYIGLYFVPESALDLRITAKSVKPMVKENEFDCKNEKFFMSPLARKISESDFDSGNNQNNSYILIKNENNSLIDPENQIFENQTFSPGANQGPGELKRTRSLRLGNKEKISQEEKRRRASLRRQSASASMCNAMSARDVFKRSKDNLLVLDLEENNIPSMMSGFRWDSDAIDSSKKESSDNYKISDKALDETTSLLKPFKSPIKSGITVDTVISPLANLEKKSISPSWVSIGISEELLKDPPYSDYKSISHNEGSLLSKDNAKTYGSIEMKSKYSIEPNSAEKDNELKDPALLIQEMPKLSLRRARTLSEGCEVAYESLRDIYGKDMDLITAHQYSRSHRHRSRSFNTYQRPKSYSPTHTVSATLASAKFFSPIEPATDVEEQNGVKNGIIWKSGSKISIDGRTDREYSNGSIGQFVPSGKSAFSFLPVHSPVRGSPFHKVNENVDYDVELGEEMEGSNNFRNGKKNEYLRISPKEYISLSDSDSEEEEWVGLTPLNRKTSAMQSQASSSNNGDPCISTVHRVYKESKGAANAVYALLSIKVYRCLLGSMTALYFTVTGVQFWGTKYLNVSLGAPLPLVHALFILCAATGPTLGVFFGGWIVDMYGGYKGPRQRQTALEICCTFGLIGSICSFPVTLLNNIFVVASFLWLVLFFGGATLPACSGMLVSIVPRDYRAISSSLSMVVFNMFGYFLSLILSGYLMQLLQSIGQCDDACSMTWGFRLILFWSVISVIFLSLSLRQSHKDKKKLETERRKIDESLAFDIKSPSLRQ